MIFSSVITPLVIQENADSSGSYLNLHLHHHTHLMCTVKFCIQNLLLCKLWKSDFIIAAPCVYYSLLYWNTAESSQIFQPIIPVVCSQDLTPFFCINFCCCFVFTWFQGELEWFPVWFTSLENLTRGYYHNLLKICPCTMNLSGS